MIERRKLIGALGLGAGGLILSGCDRLDRSRHFAACFDPAKG
jgi:hypothetical protein